MVERGITTTEILLLPLSITSDSHSNCLKGSVSFSITSDDKAVIPPAEKTFGAFLLIISMTLSLLSKCFKTSGERKSCCGTMSRDRMCIFLECWACTFYSFQFRCPYGRISLFRLLHLLPRTIPCLTMYQKAKKLESQQCYNKQEDINLRGKELNHWYSITLNIILRNDLQSIHYILEPQSYLQTQNPST